MEVKVGIVQGARELSIETASSAADVEAAFARAIADDAVMTLVDERGRKLLIPAERIAYVEVGQEHSRPVGFGTV
jgi:DNA-binding transcriptional regulator/RsmH inhibitor MraZ